MRLPDAVPVIELLERFQRCRLDQDWPTMRQLLHSDARLESLAAPDQTLGSDGLVDAIKLATARRLYSVPVWHPEKLSDHAALVEGRVRYRYGKSGIIDERRVWLTTERDGLIWRMRIFRERSVAIECLGSHGAELGLQ